MLNFYVLGSVAIGDDQHHHAAPRGISSVIFAMLLLRFNQPIQPRELVASLWPGSPPASAGANVRQYISRLRRFLRGHAQQDASRLQLTYGGYLLQLRRDELDLTRFEDLADAGRRAFDRGDLRAASRHLGAAVGQWRGDLCQGLHLGPEYEASFRYWEERRVETGRLLLRTRLALGECDRAIAEIQPLVAADPFREDLWALLMVALHRSNRRGEALEVYRAVRRRFTAELGIEPSSRLQLLHSSLLRDEEPVGGTDLRDPTGGLVDPGANQVVPVQPGA